MPLSNPPTSESLHPDLENELEAGRVPLVDGDGERGVQVVLEIGRGEGHERSHNEVTS